MTVKRDYYPNGQLHYEASYKEDKLHGVIRDWYKNGQLEYEVSYQEGRRHGIEKGWNEKGKLEYTFHYLYGNQVTEEDDLKHQLIEELAGIKG